MANRARTVGQPGANTLVVLAGFPKSISPTLVQRVRSHASNLDAVSVPFSEDDSRVYSPGSQAFRQLLLATCGATLTQQKKESKSRVPTPHRLLLIYARSQGFKCLLDAFNFSPFCLPVEPPTARWTAWRKNLDAVSEMISAQLAYARSSEGVPMAVRLRVESQDPTDPLLLPPLNYQLQDGRELTHLFSEVQAGNQDLTTIDTHLLPVQTFTEETMPNFFRKVPGKKRRFRVDNRGLVFAFAVKGQHGAVYHMSVTSEAEAALLLRKLFRFGTPVPPGFQHDVQWPGTRTLVREQFHCGQDGPGTVTNSHANIFASDVVTPLSPVK